MGLYIHSNIIQQLKLGYNIIGSFGERKNKELHTFYWNSKIENTKLLNEISYFKNARKTKKYRTQTRRDLGH
jgi:hypothetical protein